MYIYVYKIMYILQKTKIKKGYTLISITLLHLYLLPLQDLNLRPSD